VAALDRLHSPALRSAERYARLSAEGGAVIVALHGDAVQGFAALSRVLDEGTLLNIVVAPDARRGGCGRALLRAVVDEARRLSLRRLLLEVRESNAAARGLYAEFGFTADALRPGYYPARGGQPAEAAILMSLCLEEGLARTGNG
jgi:ribosomal-protein-alanine N-acetyltransferase